MGATLLPYLRQRLAAVRVGKHQTTLPATDHLEALAEAPLHIQRAQAPAALAPLGKGQPVATVLRHPILEPVAVVEVQQLDQQQPLVTAPMAVLDRHGLAQTTQAAAAAEPTALPLRGLAALAVAATVGTRQPPLRLAALTPEVAVAVALAGPLAVLADRES